ncbi:MAG: tRNA (adenosine(37)-N6)-threonylcarbamoyltransferase complex transferase subunit TsaD [Deltaproteobacteria bacterium]|nr:tRNA (adenosine(37)-N6)-threonylcarbamoyltransferase complex transferase subunit TsaD [Deltaproteobacteria bacterium]
MVVLGIETSCDETAAAVVSEEGILSDVVYTQTVHEAYRGVVPELAARAHAEKITAVTREALARAGVERPEAICATTGPGLIGALLVGATFARSLALGWGLPFVAVNHLEGHLLSPLLERPAPTFPFLGLVVSGGHTTLYLARALGEYEALASTVDDAAGEAYDKVARALSLGYPGGPLIDRLAATGDASAVTLPRPKLKGSDDLSFSGLKTAVRQRVESGLYRREDVAASFQEAVVDVLMDRVMRAVERTGVTQVALAGGVAANSALRARVMTLPGVTAFVPARSRCTDNGAMIANAGRLRLLAGQRDPLNTPVRPNWPLERL